MFRHVQYISANEIRRYIGNIFSRWQRLCSATNRDQSRSLLPFILKVRKTHFLNYNYKIVMLNIHTLHISAYVELPGFPVDMCAFCISPEIKIIYYNILYHYIIYIHICIYMYIYIETYISQYEIFCYIPIWDMIILQTHHNTGTVPTVLRDFWKGWLLHHQGELVLI